MLWNKTKKLCILRFNGGMNFEGGSYDLCNYESIIIKLHCEQSFCRG